MLCVSLKPADYTDAKRESHGD